MGEVVRVPWADGVYVAPVCLPLGALLGVAVDLRRRREEDPRPHLFREREGGRERGRERKRKRRREGGRGREREGGRERSIRARTCHRIAAERGVIA